MALNQLYFREDQHQVFFHDIRIFVFGCDVTPWLSGTVSVTTCDRYGPNTAQFTLANPMDAFVITKENVGWDSTKSDREFLTRQIDNLTERMTKLNEAYNIAKNTLKGVKKDEYQRRFTDAGLNDYPAYGEIVNIHDLDSWLDDAKEELTWQQQNYYKVLNGSYNRAKEQGNTRWRMASKPVDMETGVYTDAQYSEYAKKQIFEKKNQLNFDKSKNYIVDPLTGNPIYPLNPGSCIFHKHDTVRIFAHNPMREPKRVASKYGADKPAAFEEEWMPIFAGFVDKKPRVTNHISGQSSITLTCYCIKGMTQKIRFQTNPVSQQFGPDDRGSAIFDSNVGFFADVQVASQEALLSMPLAQLDMEHAVATLILGGQPGYMPTAIERKYGAVEQADKTVIVNLPDKPTILNGAVGGFTLGGLYEFNGLEKDSLNFEGKNVKGRQLLQEWYELCLFGSPRSFLSRQEVDEIGKASGPYDKMSPWYMQLFMLLPGNGTGIKDVTTYTVDAMAESREWDTKYNIILNVITNLDYQWWTTPMGDMVIEFPMMDFHPEDFGTFQKVLEYDKHIIETEVGDEDGEIISYLTCEGGTAIIPIQEGAYGGTPQAYIPRITIQSDMIAVRFGVIGGEPKTFPFLATKDEELYKSSLDIRLDRLGLIEFQKRLAEANTLSFKAAFRPFILPNKPVKLIPEDRMGTTTNISLTYNLPPANSASSDITLRYIRTLMPDGKYLLITGGSSMPISYRNIYQTNETFRLKEGVSIRHNDLNTAKEEK